jgi:hypothetical protein
MRSRVRAPIRTFVSVRPGGRVVRYHETSHGYWKRNPLSDLSGLEIALIATGVGVVGYITYLFWSSSQQNAAIAAAGGTSGTTSPELNVAATEEPSAPVPVWEGSVLPSQYYWGNQNNTTTPTFGSTVKALAMTSYGIASTIFGSVYVPLSPGGNTTFIVTGQTPDDPNNGISYGQSITLPLSFIQAAS